MTTDRDNASEDVQMQRKGKPDRFGWIAGALYTAWVVLGELWIRARGIFRRVK